MWKKKLFSDNEVDIKELAGKIRDMSYYLAFERK